MYHQLKLIRDNEPPQEKYIILKLTDIIVNNPFGPMSRSDQNISAQIPSWKLYNISNKLNSISI